jgi:hypothetical protein
MTITTGATQSMTAQTASYAAHTHAHHQPSRKALATRSLTAVNRLTGDAYREALAKHVREFASGVGSVCRR